MTYNQVIARIKALALAHKQVRFFARGLITDFLTDKTIPYAAIFLEDGGASINPGTHMAAFSFRLRFVDLVHVSEDAKSNELDVLSDTFSIAMDIISQMGYPAYNDWKVSLSNNLQRLVEEDGDMYAGWVADMSVQIIYDQNVCEVPTTIPGYEPIEPEDMKLVYDYKYVADGSEDLTIVAPVDFAGKKIIMVTREYSVLYKVSNLPQSTEFTWNDVEIGLGLPTIPGERFLILYRNY